MLPPSSPTLPPTPPCPPFSSWSCANTPSRVNRGNKTRWLLCDFGGCVGPMAGEACELHLNVCWCSRYVVRDTPRQLTGCSTSLTFSKQLCLRSVSLNSHGDGGKIAAVNNCLVLLSIRQKIQMNLVGPR